MTRRDSAAVRSECRRACVPPGNGRRPRHRGRAAARNQVTRRFHFPHTPNRYRYKDDYSTHYTKALDLFLTYQGRRIRGRVRARGPRGEVGHIVTQQAP